MKISTSLNVLYMIACLIFFASQIRSVSSSKYSVETIDDEVFLSEKNNKLQMKNTIKNKINMNNRKNKDFSNGYRDL